MPLLGDATSESIPINPMGKGGFSGTRETRFRAIPDLPRPVGIPQAECFGRREGNSTSPSTRTGVAYGQGWPTTHAFNPAGRILFRRCLTYATQTSRRPAEANTNVPE